MTLRLALALALLACPVAAQAQDSRFAFSNAARADFPGEVVLGTGPGEPVEDWYRINGSLQVRNISAATLTPFLPTAKANTGAAVIVAPGGGFLGLAIEEEGYRIARWLADHGIAAFVLKYRLLPTPADPSTFRRELVSLRAGGKASFRPQDDTPASTLADGQAALRHVRANAAKYRVDPAKIGMMGFSAGAFLTLSVTYANDPTARPAFIAPIYGHQRASGTVPQGAPPMFALIASDDVLFARGEFGLVDSWHKAGAPVEFHLLQNGGHGFGLGSAGTSSNDWIFLFERWLAVNRIIPAPR